jgi:hypothetical protein
MSGSLTQRLLWVLWPSFLVAGAAELVFFAVIDPHDLHLFGVPVEAGRMPVYTLGFFFFWSIGAAAAALAVFLARAPVEINRGPPDAEDRGRLPEAAGEVVKKASPAPRSS